VIAFQLSKKKSFVTAFNFICQFWKIFCWNQSCVFYNRLLFSS